MTARLSLLAAATGALALAGCNAGPLSTAAAMRVEVEVYKGPLSKEPEVQLGELVATLDEASNSLSQLHMFMAARIQAVAEAQGRTLNPEGKISEVEFMAWKQVVQDVAQARHDVVRMQERAQGFTRWYYMQLSGAPISSTARPAYELAGLLKIMLQPAPVQFTKDHAETCQGVPVDSLSSGAVLSSQVELQLSQRLAFCLADAGKRLAELRNVLAAKRSDRAQLDYSLSLDRIRGTDEWKQKVNAADGAVKTADEAADKQGRAVAALSLGLSELAATAAAQRADRAYAALKDLKEPAKQKEYLVILLSDVSGLARQLHAKALFWSGSHISYAFTGFEGTRIPANLAALLGTYADRLGPRADSLIKQVRGADRESMALSVALRETSPPAFLKQYIWNDAGGSLTGMFAGANTTRDRVREIDRLYTDENWTNINTVFASGQGTVRMALIKDDIGNWNLKSFDQDPTELLNAYRNVGLAGLKAATGLISAAVSGGSSAAAMQALSMANQLTSGTAPGGAPTIGSSNLAELRGEVTKRLNELYTNAQSEDEILGKQIAPKSPVPNLYSAKEEAAKFRKEKRDALDKEAAKLSPGTTTSADHEAALADWAKASATVDAAEAAFNSVQARRTALPATMLVRAREILAAHEKVVDALEGAIVRNRSTTPDLKDMLSKTPARTP